jgi:capsular exopolysaccharide synthesis family protein
MPREGKSTIAANLAAAHAEQGKRTLIIDGDLRRPTLHKLFNLPGTFGLSNLLVAGTDWRQAVLPHAAMPNLEVLPAGSHVVQASHLVGSGLAQVIEEASAIYDLVILDSPPLLGFAEPLEMASLVDGVVVVARAGETDRKAIGTVINTLQRLRANVIGLVLNEVDTGHSRSYGYYKSYGKYYKS